MRPLRACRGARPHRFVVTLLLSTWVLASCGGDDDGSPVTQVDAGPAPSLPSPTPPASQPPGGGGSAPPPSTGGTNAPPGGGFVPEPSEPTEPSTSEPPPAAGLDIQGAPATSVLYDADYEFVPSVTHEDDDALTFTVENLPAWAEFDADTGRLSGTPGVEHIGSYTDISISVSDGEHTASLPGFSIDVVAVAGGSITVSLEPPTERSDGAPLVNLAGYKIYWGRKKDDYTSSVTIDNPGLTLYVIEQLTPGTYYVAATAYDSAGIESSYSNIGRAKVQ